MKRLFLFLAAVCSLLPASCCCSQCLGTGETSKGACPYCGGNGGWNVSATPFSDQEW
ncbi:MAG: hypothetical protein IJB00_06525 [Akkermansia sp.]|nr:hypothetical protein [Akkermansia sp.]